LILRLKIFLGDGIVGNAGYEIGEDFDLGQNMALEFVDFAIQDLNVVIVVIPGDFVETVIIESEKGEEQQNRNEKQLFLDGLFR